MSSEFHDPDPRDGDTNDPQMNECEIPMDMGEKIDDMFEGISDEVKEQIEEVPELPEHGPDMVQFPYEGDPNQDDRPPEERYNGFMAEALTYHGHPHFKTIMTEVIDLHERKNKQYAETGDFLGNFYRGGEEMKDLLPEGLDKWQRAALYAMFLVHKQIDGLKRMILFDKTGTPDSVAEKSRDVVCYYGIIECIMKERHEYYELQRELAEAETCGTAEED